MESSSSMVAGVSARDASVSPSETTLGGRRMGEKAEGLERGGERGWGERGGEGRAGEGRGGEGRGGEKEVGKEVEFCTLLAGHIIMLVMSSYIH